MSDDRAITENLGWALIPPNVLSNEKLTSTEKLLLGRIIGLSGKSGHCFASNAWLSQGLGLTKRHVADCITTLADKGYIIRKIDRDSNNVVVGRRLYPVNTLPRSIVGGIPLELGTSPDETEETKGRVEGRVEKKKLLSADKPRFPAEWYKQNADDYQKIKGVTLNGPEFGEIQRTLKAIYQADHAPEDVRALMEAFEASKEEWTNNWTIHTVARKLPEFKARKLFGNNGELPPNPKTTALKEDIYQVDRAIIAVQRTLDAYALTESGTRRHKPRELTIDEEEKRAQLHDTLTEKEEERTRLVRELKK